MIGYIAVYVLYSLSRVVESIMDAEQFESPRKSRSKLWHWLKFPRVIGIFLFGYLVNEIDLDTFSLSTGLNYIGILGLGFGVFELSLKYFRKYFKKRR